MKAFTSFHKQPQKTALFPLSLPHINVENVIFKHSTCLMPTQSSTGWEGGGGKEKLVI